MDGFESWAERHCGAFGMSNDESKTVLTWEPFFEASGWTCDDLGEATKAFISDPGSMVTLAGEAKFLGKCPLHLAAIEKFIRQASAVQHRAETKYETENGICAICSGTGFVCVPHPGGIVGGRWAPQTTAAGRSDYHTCAVTCSCGLGRFKAEVNSHRTRKGKTLGRQMSLYQYESLNPGWKDQMIARRKADIEMAKLRKKPPIEKETNETRSKMQEMLAKAREEGRVP